MIKTAFESLWSCIIWLLIAVFTLTGAVWLWILGRLPQSKPRVWLTQFSAFHNWARLIFYPGFPRIRVFQLQEDLSPPKIYLSNHLSMVDIPLLMSILPWGFRFLSKKENFQVPFLGYCMRFLGFVSVDRQNKVLAHRSIELAGRLVAEEKLSVWLAPEGTRSKDGNLGPFKTGPFLLANSAKVPIIPIFIRGTRGVHRKGSWRFGLFQKVDVVIGSDFKRHLGEIPYTIPELRDAIRMEIEALESWYRDEVETREMDYPYPLFGQRRFQLAWNRQDRRVGQESMEWVESHGRVN